ncbi:MAG: carbon-nitrogen family hydrolase [Chloroflexi bacterium]|nr:MAG: carbon-nitrogen family hydrolase [Chloroflexota bacterium]
MPQLTVTLVQMDCTLAQPSHNFERAAGFVAEAARRGSDLVVLPELWNTAYDLENAADHASPLAQNADEPGAFGDFARLARENRVWLVGSLLESRGGRHYNTAALYSPAGELQADYSKIHLVPMLDEHLYLAGGEKRTLAETPWGKAGLAICYDLRFPELFRRYALDGARLMILPAEWPHPRRPHWQTLLRARAIENQCYVLACNRVGSSKGVNFCGSSAVIDPWGEALVEGGETEALLTVSFDPAFVDTVRQRIPIFANRREELYK